MGVITAEPTPATENKRPRRLPSPVPGFLAACWIILAEICVNPDVALREGPVLLVMVLSFWAGIRWGRSEQARELLRGNA
jgi:hypothetical protein